MAAPTLSMGNPMREAKQRIRDLYERFNLSTESWSLTAVREAARDLLDDLQDRLVDVVADKLVDDVDRERTKHDTQPSFFDLEGVFPLGGSERIAKRNARLEHLEKVLALDDMNLAAVQGANRKKHEDFARLRPYLGPNVSLEAAVAACNADHPA